MKITITVQEEGMSPAGQGNITMLIATALSYLSQDESFPGFQQFGVTLAENDPANPAIAGWWKRMDPGVLAWLAQGVIDGARE